jgi:hypothetical protein
LKDKSCGFGVYKHLACRQRNCIVRGVVSKSVQENKLRANRSKSVNESLGFLAVQRSCRVSDIRGGRVGKAISDQGGEDRLESLIFAIVLLILINLTVILMILMNLTIVLMILMNLTMILIIILTVRDKKSRWKTLTVAPWQ